MTRKKVLNGIKEIVTNSDVIFCVGKAVCTEAPVYNAGTLYINNDSIDIFSVALGVALSTDKRVIIVAEDTCFLRYFNTVLQAAVSKCINLFFIILVTDLYEPSLRQTTITKAFRSIKGILFNAGMITHDYSIYFDTKVAVKTLKNIILNTIGPAVGFVNIDNNRLYTKDSTHSVNFSNLIKFIRDKKLKTVIKKTPTKPFDLDSITK